MLTDDLGHLHRAAFEAEEDRHRATQAAAWARHLTAHPPATEAHVARLTAFCASLRGEGANG